MIPTVTIRRSQTAVLLEVDAGEHGELPREWLIRWRLAAAQAVAHPDDYQASDSTFAAARVRTRRSQALLALAEEARDSTENGQRGHTGGDRAPGKPNADPPIRLNSASPSRVFHVALPLSTMDGD